jgi:hypothetical protein
LDFFEAARLMTLAADQHFAMAQNHLSWFYALGVGVDQDLEKAHALCVAAAQQDLSTAQNHLGVMYKYGLRTTHKNRDEAKNSTTERKEFIIEKDKEKAMEHFLPAAQQGHASAQFHLATLYERNRGGESNYDYAAVWYKQAGVQGHKLALYNLAKIHEEGRGVVQSLRTAAQLYEQAAELGYAPAQLKYGTMLINGIGVPLDKKEGNLWLKKAEAHK